MGELLFQSAQFPRFWVRLGRSYLYPPSYHLLWVLSALVLCMYCPKLRGNFTKLIWRHKTKLILEGLHKPTLSAPLSNTKLTKKRGTARHASNQKLFLKCLETAKDAQ